MKKNEINKASLWEEMLEYEKQTQMTEEERHALHEWVLDVIRQIIWSRFRQFIWMCSQVQIAYWSG